jgi:hypothetical protein
VTVTNVGSQVFRHTLHILDYDAWPGPIVSLTGEWGCGVALPGCYTSSEITLNPTDSITFRLGITLAEDFAEDTFRNCAIIGWLPMGFPHGFDMNPGNDQNCAEHVVGTEDDGPAEVGAVDLEIIKEVVSSECRLGADCTFRITIRNVGTADYSGGVTVDDIPSVLPAGGALPGGTVSTSDPAWTCGVLVGPEALCFSNTDVTLAAGAPGVQFDVTVRVPASATGETLRNCSNLRFEHMGPIADIGDGNNRDCATIGLQPSEDGPVDVVSHDLQVTKTARHDQCQRGGSCDFLIEITNVGTEDYTGAVVLGDTAASETGAVFSPAGIRSISAGFECSATGPITVCRSSEDLTLPAGGTGVVHFEVSVDVPATSPATRLGNCAGLLKTQMPDLVDLNFANDQNCATRDIVVPIEPVEPDPEPEMIDLGVALEERDACVAGEGCSISGTLLNMGPGTFSGRPRLSRRILLFRADGSHQTVFESDNVLLEDLTLAPGQSRRSNLYLSIPSGDEFVHVRGCHGVNPVNNGITEPVTPEATSNNTACVTVHIRRPTAAINLAMSTQALGTCRLGAPCNIGIRIRNTSRETFVGELGIDGRIEPAVRLRQISALGPGWSCQSTGDGTYQCRHNPITLAPGAQQSFRISAAIPPNLTTDAITHSARLVWIEGRPDADSKDDEATVTIPLVQADVTPVAPTRPACTGGRRWNGSECVCRRGYEWDGRSCVRQPPTMGCIGGRTVDGICRCPAGWRRVVHSRDRFRCVPPRSRPEVRCINGDVRNNRCYCPNGWTRRQVDTTTYRCDRPQVRILCEGGKVRDNRCYCPRGWRMVRRGTNAFRCVRPQAQKIRCVNGAVRNGECICPKGWRRLRRGRNNFRCVRPQAQISCAGGTVRGGRCVCRRGYQARRVGRNAFRCIPRQVQIRCSGGSVRNGRCVCPAGKVARRVGRNAYRCVWRAPD